MMYLRAHKNEDIVKNVETQKYTMYNQEIYGFNDIGCYLLF